MAITSLLSPGVCWHPLRLLAYRLEMRHQNRTLILAVVMLCSVLVSGCVAYALSCHPGEPSVDCCIKKFPLSPVESCSASVADANRVLSAMAVAIAAAAANDATDVDDESASTKNLPEWKRRCIDNYVECINKGWTGDCYDCIRYCEGQQSWPTAMCAPKRKR